MIARPQGEGGRRGPAEWLLRAGLLPLALVTLGAWAGSGTRALVGPEAKGATPPAAPSPAVSTVYTSEATVVPVADACCAADTPAGGDGEACTASACFEPCVAGGAEATADGEQRQRRRGRSRDRSAQYDRAIEILDLQPGDVVAEIGAGNGRFSRAFAPAVGPEGRVYANELDSADVRRMREQAEEDGLDNFVAVQGEVDDTNLEDECCDAMMMRMVYHMLTDPEPMSVSFYRALRPGGRLLILEGNPKPGEKNAEGVPANRAGMGIDPQIVIDELAAVGFEFEEHYESFPNVGYGLLFRKPR